MPPAVNPAPWMRTCAFRARRPNGFLPRPIMGVKRAAHRHYSVNDPNKLPKAEQGQPGPNTQQQEHVSEEAAKMAQVQGMEGPDVEAGTPVQEILAEDKDASKHAPKVIQEEAKQAAENPQPSTSTGGRRQFSTMARRRMEMETTGGQLPLDPAVMPSASQIAAYQTTPSTETATGHKFPLPTTPLPPNSHLKNRHDPIVLQLTNLMMRDGKKSRAEKNMAYVLNALRTAPAPTYNSSRPLLPGAPPASQLPLNPVLYLTLAIDSVAPLLRIRSQRGAAGGGVALQIPVPLGLRQRRSQAFKWVMDAASKRRNTEGFAQRLANEIIGIVEGKSSVWEKRQAVHRLGTTARSNLNFGRKGGRR